MWTSTHDANAPSEDRYSSLVNVLLRPPKTPRKCSSGGGGRSASRSSEVGSGGSKLATRKMVDNETHEMTTNNTRGDADDAVSMADKTGPAVHTGSHDVEANDRQAREQGGAADMGGSDGLKHHDSDEEIEDDDDENTSLIRLSLWSVIDGHGGGCVATYAAEVLLPHIAASVARALKSEIVDRGVCNVNGQLRDANALDLDGLIRSSDRSKHVGKVRVRQREAGIDAVNPNSIHYRSPYEESESGNEHDHFDGDEEEEESGNDHVHSDADVGMRSESESEAPGNSNKWTHGESVSSVKTSLKTAISPNTQHAPMGTHSPAEVAAITRAITDSFLSVDEGWINSIDPVTTHQTSCVSNGRWNAGACALIVFIVQRLDWCRFSRADHEIHHRESGVDGFDDTSHNRDAARRRKLDYAGKSKSDCSLSTLSSTSSITTEANVTENMLVEESEITETEDDDNVSDIFGQRRLSRKKGTGHHLLGIDDPHHQEANFIATPAGCKCHYYRPHDAMLYTAHVGDCRAVMLGSAPPRTIKVPPEGDSNLSLDHTDTSEDESSSESVADEISSSEHDSDSSGDDDDHFMRHGGTATGSLVNHALSYVRKRRRREDKTVIDQPFIPLPPLNLRRDSSSEESAIESDDSASTTSQDDVLPVGAVRGISEPRGVGVVTIFNDLSEEEKFLETEDEDEIKEIRSVRSGSPTQMDRLPSPSPTQLLADPVHPPPLPLSMQMRPIDLTTDHSAYNPAEVTAVLRRCNNAPKAISAASSGGIKRVAGSLAVTRALGDAYLKTPRLSFFPYKRHAPYITARPEVNCRILTKGADRILTLASDGVWERASGDDVLRWVRNYYNSRIAGVKEQQLLSMYDMEDDDHDVIYGEASRRNSLLTEKALQSTGINSNPVAAFGLGCTTSGDIISEVTKSTVQENMARLTTLSSIVDVGKTPTANESAAVASGDDKLDEGATTTFNPMGTSSSLSESTTSAKMSSKRKRPDSNTFDDSVSSRSGSTTSSQSCGVGASMPTLRRHYYSSSRSPYSLPTVSDVIVHKVLNKVRKTRNISSLRMLMSLPKGRARRSKHDDITATVVDLDYFI